MTTAGSIGMHRLSVLIAKVTLYHNFISIKHRQVFYCAEIQGDIKKKKKKEANN